MNKFKKNNNWHDYPQEIKHWNKDIDYIMFIDENRNGGKITNTLKKIINNDEINENDKYFTITGCIFEKKEYEKAKIEFTKLKNKYWKNGMYYDTKDKIEKYICFHSREIRRHDKAFNDEIINHNKFLADLTETLNNTNCKIISVTIDLVKYLKNGYIQNVYETAFDLLLERYIYITRYEKKGIIILEARGKKEDKQLLNHIYNIIYNRDKNKITTNELKSKIQGIYFNPKWNEKYISTYVGLEITDLFSYPIHQYIKYNKENPSFEILKKKIDGYPKFINKGIIIFQK